MIENQVLYLSYDGMTDPLGQSQVLPYLCGLNKLGYKFTLISFEKKEKFEQNKSKIELICKENNIDWRPQVYHKFPPILSTMWDILQMRSIALSLHSKNKFDLIHCRSYISALIGLMMKKKHNVKFLFDMRGLWADEKVDAGAWDIQNPIYKIIYQFFKTKEKEFVLNADQIISLTEKGKQEIQSWNYLNNVQEKITVIPCCADLDLFDSSKVHEESVINWRNKLGITESDFVLSYLGSLGTWYMLEEMLDFFKVFLRKQPNAKFLFITHDEHERIFKEAESRSIRDKIIIQSGARSEVPSLLSLSSVSIFFIRSTYSKVASSPTKQGELMAMGIPVICNQGVGDTANLVRKYKSGIVVSHFESSDYESAIEQFFRSNFDKSKLRMGADDYFSLEQGIRSYLEVYQKCLG